MLPFHVRPIDKHAYSHEISNKQTPGNNTFRNTWILVFEISRHWHVKAPTESFRHVRTACLINNEIGNKREKHYFTKISDRLKHSRFFAKRYLCIM
jgi:hypothetical protein